MTNVNVRLPAEWEPQSAIQLTWPHDQTIWGENYGKAIDCFKNLIKEVTSRQNLLLVCHDAKQVKKQLKGINFNRVLFAEAPSNDIWARDHAPLTVLKGKIPILMDFVFNGWGMKFPADLDNQIAGKLKAKGIYGSLIMESIPFILEGGSIDSDGAGTILTTSKCLLSPNRNRNYTKKDVSDILVDYLGVQRVLWLDYGYLAGDDTDSHIDMLARFTDEETIVYSAVEDVSDEHFEELFKMKCELEEFTTLAGEPYVLIPLPIASCKDLEGNRLPASYTNFLIINSAVLVPQYNAPEDAIAMETLKKCFPGREMVGIDCAVLISQGGSLHCATMQYPNGVF